MGGSCFLVKARLTKDKSFLLMVMRVGGEAECAGYKATVRLGDSGGGSRLMFEGRPVSTETPKAQWEEVRPVGSELFCC